MKKTVYLISPNKINRNFYYRLDKVLSVNNVKYFQLRLKKKKLNSLLKIANKIKKITKKHKVKLIINDNYILASKILVWFFCRTKDEELEHFKVKRITLKMPQPLLSQKDLCSFGF